MNKSTLVYCGLFFIQLGSAQNVTTNYSALIKKADSLYLAKDYENSAFNYSSAFKTLGWKGYEEDRYKAGRSWALSHHPDSALFQFFRIAQKLNYSNYERLNSDKDLEILHKEKAWIELLSLVKQNHEKKEALLHHPIKRLLDSIYFEDQQGRQALRTLDKKEGDTSVQRDSIWKSINAKDLSNTKVVTEILDRKGWLGADSIGEQANSTLFLVIQHSDLATQEKYLPMMQEAAKNGKASTSSLAMLEDRINMNHGKKQRYGSQLCTNSQIAVLGLFPVQNPDSLNTWRKEVGLQAIEDYLLHWNITWDLEKYKKEAILKEQNFKALTQPLINKKGIKN